ncbi:PREDICTED: kinesin-like protein KIF20B [Papilio xuthus]|uniref:Kinesin-like protein KIF20B n=1 Tax=Papilio xuthus TaxID=66420 RepID=A0AAJ7E7K9_PAPXU|nr:PREDICTED: kinesin-like protein KIF20B [Papilio xuthus]
MINQRISDSDVSNCKRDVPSFIEPRPPLISNPFMRPKPQKGTNLLDLFETDSESDEPELVQVYLRLKPCNAPSNLYEVKSDHCLITSLDTSTVGHGRRTQYNVSKMYTFSHIFGPEANQTELFERVVKDNLKKLPEGHSFTLLTYGASGSGKTFTLMGTVSSPGLVPRSLEYVFRVVDAAVRPVYKPADNGAEKLSYASQEHELQFVKQLRQVSVPLRERYRRMSTKLHSDFAASTLDLANRIKYYVWVSFVEIYNEGIYDLLSTNDRSSASKLVIREDSNGNVYVKGATQVFVKTGEEAYDVMVAGKHNLQVAATGVNARSSRSHCIFTITMLTETEAGCRVSSVRLCDLAGCERARRTRNAGARLAESRAINTSLHVLERCLRTLRQRQRARTDALVPYRESKLTRLLGAGLSGARGEAVSVVVTVNPAAECALETRHVLQLAAVARDIQVNNTASEYSALEASSQDTMLSQTSSASSAEVQRLRAENERLHFELLQAQEYSKELAMSMEEQQAQNASNMKAVFSEGQHIMRQHYETIMRSMRQEMEEMKQEYEDKISKLSLQPAPADGSPTRLLKNEVSDLMREIDNLEGKLAAEVSAREGAEQEVCKLRAYIEEMEEKVASGAQNKYEEVISLTESEDDSEEDPCNESLEPVIRKERSRLLRQSLASFSNILNESVEVSGDARASEVDEGICREDVEDIENDEEVKNKSQDIEKISEENVESFGCIDRGTYFVKEPEIVLSSSKTVEDKYNQRVRETYFVRKSQDDSKSDESSEQEQEIDKDDSETEIDKEADLNEEKENADLTSPMCDNLEKLEENLNSNKSYNFTMNNKNDEDSKDEIKTYEEMNDMLEGENINKIVPLTKSDSLENSVDDSNLNKSLNTEKEIINNVEKEIETESQIEINNGKETSDVPDPTKSLMNKIFKKLKSNSGEYSSNNSLAQFEQLEMEANDLSSDPKRKTFDVLSNINIFKEKKNFFDVTIPEKPEDLNCEESNDEKKDLADDLNVQTEKYDKLSHIKNMHQLKNDELRSPSIVKDDCVSNFEPSTIKKLLGESFTRQLDSVSTLKNKNFKKKHDSVDPFDDLESPRKAVENIGKSFSDINLSKNNECDVKSNPEPEESDINKPLMEDISIATKPSDSALIEKETKVDNTLEAFENIYKDISQPRATDFDLLVAQEESSCNKEDNKEEATSITQEGTQEATEVKYNLRKKLTSRNGDDSDKTNEIVARAKRNLRLRRHKKQMDEAAELEEGDKLKDIINLQVQFSDVTLGKPAPEPPARPASPEPKGEENLPPLGIQSCPSKSVTRSRRKLFTPRAEPLEDESGPCGDSGERLRVPRPSYHRPRARRKL